LRPRDLIRALFVALMATSPSLSAEGLAGGGGAPLSALGAENACDSDVGQPFVPSRVGARDTSSLGTAARARRAAPDVGGRAHAAVTTLPPTLAPAAAANALVLTPARPPGRPLLSARSSRGPPPLV
jgi:hypothetical protein